jgi:hypothetical protein
LLAHLHEYLPRSGWVAQVAAYGARRGNTFAGKPTAHIPGVGAHFIVRDKLMFDAEHFGAGRTLQLAGAPERPTRVSIVVVPAIRERKSEARA